MKITRISLLAVLLSGFVLLLPAFRLVPATAQPTSGETSRDTTEFDTKIRAFFANLAKGNTQSALDDFLRQSSLGGVSAANQISELKTQIDDMKTQFGNILDSEKLDVKRIGEDITIVRYILKYDQYPVIWTFTFYRKPILSTSPSMSVLNPWILIEMRFDTNFLS